jgi:hypothetical protein
MRERVQCADQVARFEREMIRAARASIHATHSTSVNVQCPSHLPFVANADLFFFPKRTVPIVGEP